MTRSHCFGFVLGIGLLLASLSPDAFASDPHCTPIGGAISTNLGGFGLIDGWPTSMGTATGDLKGAIGIQIVAASPDFTSITVQHHWVTENGETLNLDQATLQAVYVDQSRGLLGVKDYKVHLSGGTGRFANGKGDLSFIGEIDLNAGAVVLRYSGNVCFSGNEK